MTVWTGPAANRNVYGVIPLVASYINRGIDQRFYPSVVASNSLVRGVGGKD